MEWVVGDDNHLEVAQALVTRAFMNLDFWSPSEQGLAICTQCVTEAEEFFRIFGLDEALTNAQEKHITEDVKRPRRASENVVRLEKLEALLQCDDKLQALLINLHNANFIDGTDDPVKVR